MQRGSLLRARRHARHFAVPARDRSAEAPAGRRGDRARRRRAQSVSSRRTENRVMPFRARCMPRDDEPPRPLRERRSTSVRDGAAGPGGPAGLQNPCGRATHGSVGSTPAPLRFPCLTDSAVRPRSPSRTPPPVDDRGLPRQAALRSGRCRRPGARPTMTGTRGTDPELAHALNVDARPRTRESHLGYRHSQAAREGTIPTSIPAAAVALGRRAGGARRQT